MEARIQLALTAYRTGQFPSIRKAADAHNVNYSTLSRRVKHGLSRQQARNPQQLLSPV
jgi:hypothetical protein